jgi:transposase
MAYTAAYSGLRWGELIALTIPQVDTGARVITVVSLPPDHGHVTCVDRVSAGKGVAVPAPHPIEFRQRAVELARKGDKPVAQLAKDLGVSESCLRNWMSQANTDDNGGAKLTSTEKKELAELRKKARQLELENGCVLRERQAVEWNTRFTEEREDLLRRVLFRDRRGDLLEDEQTDRTIVVLTWVGKRLDDPDALSSVLPLDGQGKVGDSLQVLIGPGLVSVIGDPVRQVALVCGDLQLSEETTDLHVIDDWRPPATSSISCLPSTPTLRRRRTAPGDDQLPARS